MTTPGIYEQHLDQTRANHTALSPLSYLERAAAVYPDYPSVVYGARRYTWGETYARCRQLASALAGHGVGRGDTVSIIAANIPELYEAHFGIPMLGAVLNAINTRLDAPIIAFILQHAEAKVLLVDPEFSSVVREALTQVDRPDLLVIDIVDPSFDGGDPVGSLTYDALLEAGDPDYHWSLPVDEWDAITLNYTSGTTGNPKGVVYHHRGAALNATSNILTWGMPQHSTYLWTLPMFHCNGWCFPWAMAANAGVSVCLRAVRAEPIYQAFRDEKVTHFCGAPIVLNMLANAPDELKDFDHEIKVMTAGAPPPAAVIENMESMGIEVTHVYGLTETYGPSVVCAWKDEWNDKGPEDRAALKVRQGVKYVALSGLMVADPETLEPVPSDGETMGEIFMQGNIVMKGYLKNPEATDKAFKGGWFASGDLGVMHPDGYIALKDRSKDIIISGGENISSVEIEDVLYKHPSVMEAAVVARPDDKWGETPCAFVELKPGKDATEAEMIAFCRDHMAHFKAPRTVVFGSLPKTSTGKIQKFVLRDQARAL
ncbi:acyl-CoA synthetase [Phaeobacter gallaeciensis]|uniref:3-methylmercaptopropionyl-CoA ligase n=2 Tax=Roseobacteraceae TaxID=2854170 RepID=A0A366WNG8_9RHOB|nr:MULTISPECIES: acyl-CoA synthetase [Roseobacteraceae]MBT3140119.1 acyl-CoA synthetase [Falsiruegeria litorea]MBT8169121.1 acyl-CoA synthetase [Falsiruegeria litorea]RBW50411.1 acyl-CoA synthetase [Phaeobacter gallaeciensis]